MIHGVISTRIALALLTFVSSKPAPPAEPFAPRLRSEIATARAGLGLPALASDPELDQVAQARVDAMARDHWFGARSPSGTGVEDELDARHYAFRLVTEKLVRTQDRPAELVTGWRLELAKQAENLFHPQVTRVGIGVVEADGGRLIDIVLVEPAVPGTAPGMSSVSVDDPVAAEAALAELITQRRKAEGAMLLHTDPVLAEAAQEHAAALLKAFENGLGPESIDSLADRIDALTRSRSGAPAGTAPGDDDFQQHEIQTDTDSPRSDLSDLSSIIVAGAASAGVALATMERSQERADFLDPSLRTIGIGLAVGDGSPPVRRIAWVIAMRR
jgi:uncharacterized protein YkwD